MNIGENSYFFSSALFIRRLIQRAAAGFDATVPISVSMLLGWTRLSWRDKYYLPPRLITEEIVDRAGPQAELSEVHKLTEGD